MKLIKSVHTYFVFPHFKFLQDGNPLMDNEPGFQERLIGVRYFSIMEVLNAMLTSYPTLEAFRDFQSYNEKELNDEEKICQHKKVQETATIMMRYIDKHFSRWLNGQLLTLSLFSEKQTAMIVTKYFLGEQTPTPTTTTESSIFFSELHQQEIDLAKFSTFLSKKFVTRPAILTTNFFSDNKQVIDLMGQGMNMRQREHLPEIFQYFQQL